MCSAKLVAKAKLSNYCKYKMDGIWNDLSTRNTVKNITPINANRRDGSTTIYRIDLVKNTRSVASYITILLFD